MPDYPHRDSGFATRYTKWLIETRVPLLYGHEFFCLLVAVATEEDSLKYERPAAIWNDVLANMVGFTTCRSMERIRAKATEAGYLCYEPGSRTRPSTYWVKYPQ